jgi:hypothetical protein
MTRKLSHRVEQSHSQSRLVALRNLQNFKISPLLVMGARLWRVPIDDSEPLHKPQHGHSTIHEKPRDYPSQAVGAAQAFIPTTFQPFADTEFLFAIPPTQANIRRPQET